MKIICLFDQNVSCNRIIKPLISYFTWIDTFSLLTLPWKSLKSSQPFLLNYWLLTAIDLVHNFQAQNALIFALISSSPALIKVYVVVLAQFIRLWLNGLVVQNEALVDNLVKIDIRYRNAIVSFVSVFLIFVDGEFRDQLLDFTTLLYFFIGVLTLFRPAWLKVAVL